MSVREKLSSAEAFAAMCTDERSDCAFRPWGSRRASLHQSRPGSAVGEFHQPGAVNPRSLRTIARLPSTAADVDAIFREPKRACGGWSFIKPYNHQYEYYRTFGNAGCHALSSHHHNFPTGDVPHARRVYSAEPNSRVTVTVNRRPKRFEHAAVMTTKSFPSPLYSDICDMRSVTRGSLPYQ